MGKIAQTIKKNKPQGYMAPEVKITGFKDNQTQAFFDRVRDLQPDDDNVAERLIKLGQKHGNPNVMLYNTPELLKKSEIAGRANYSPITNRMSLSERQPTHLDNSEVPLYKLKGLESDYIAELSHGEQKRRDGKLTTALRAGKDLINRSVYGENQIYDDPKSLEYEAHQLIQPHIENEYSNMYVQDTHPELMQKLRLMKTQGSSGSYKMGGSIGKLSKLMKYGPGGILPQDPKPKQRSLKPWESLDKDGTISTDMNSLPLTKKYQSDVKWQQDWIAKRGKQFNNLAQAQVKTYAEEHPILNKLGFNDKPDEIVTKVKADVSNNLKTLKFGDESKIDPNSSLPAVWGAYSPMHHRINFPITPNPETRGHEIGHGTHLAQWKPAADLISSTMAKDKTFAKYNQSDKSYLGSNEEVYSRIWGLRRDLNLKPTDVVTPQMIKKYKDEHFLPDDNVASYMDQDNVVKLLNELVSSKTKSTDLPVGAFGGSIENMKTVTPKRTVAQAMKAKKMALGGYPNQGDYSQPETYENLVAAGIIPKGAQFGNKVSTNPSISSLPTTAGRGPDLQSATGLSSKAIVSPTLASKTTSITDTGVSAAKGNTGSGLTAANTGAIAPIASTLGTIVDATSTPDNYGVKNGGAAIGGGALKGAGTGAALGSYIGPWGTVIGAAAGAIYGGISGAVGNNKAKSKRTQAFYKLGQQQRADQNDAVATADPIRVHGSLASSYYAMGGTMKGTMPGKPRLTKPMRKVQPNQDLMPNIASVPGRQISRMAVGGDMTKADIPYWMGAKGGSMEKLSSQDTKINGNSHATGGVKFPSAGVELEGGETVNNNFVFSKQLGFAKEQEKIARATGRVEKQPDTVINKATLAALQRQTRGLKVAQEMTKAKLGIPNDFEQKAMGGVVGPGDPIPGKKAIPDPTKAPTYNPTLLTNGKFLVTKADGSTGQWGNELGAEQKLPPMPGAQPILPSNKAVGLDNTYTPAKDHRNLAKDVPTIRPSYKYGKGGKLKMAMGGYAGDPNPKYPLPDRTKAPELWDVPAELNMPNYDAVVTATRLPKAAPAIPAVQSAPANPPLSSNKKGMDWNGAINGVTPFISNISNALTKLPLPPIPILDNPITPQSVDYSASRAEAVRQTRGANKSAEQSLNSGAAVSAVRAGNLAQQQRAVGQINEAEQNTNSTLRGQAQQVNAAIKSSNNAKLNDYNNNLVERTLKGQQLKSENLANVENKIQGMARDKKMFDLEDQKTMLEALKDDTGASYRGARSIFAKHLSQESINDLDKHFTRLEADAKTDRKNNTRQNKLQLAMLKKKAEDSGLSTADILGSISTVTIAKEDNASKKRK